MPNGSRPLRILKGQKSDHRNAIDEGDYFFLNKLRKAPVSYVLIGASPGFSRLDATKVSTRGFAEMEVKASQRDDFAVGRVVTGLCVDFTRPVRT